MKGNIYSRLSIPKPCHEDWSKMTPDEKGAFCKSCNKSVYDFTSKSEEQVEAILTAAKGVEVCGRFDSTQLGSLPELTKPLYALPRNLSPYRKFVLAVFLVFGTALFGCVNSYGQKMGKVRLVTETVPVPVTEERMFKGEVAISATDKVQEAQQKIDSIKPVAEGSIAITGEINITEEPLYHLLGGISMIDYVEDPVEVPLATDNIEVIEDPVEILSCGLAMLDKGIITEEAPIIITGGIPGTFGDVPEVVQVINNIPMVKDVITCEKDGGEDMEIGSRKDISDNSIAPAGGEGLKPAIECYPNPSSGPVTIRYEIKKRSDVRMELFDRSGKKIRTLIDQRNHHNGIYNTAFDLSDVAAGTYICVLQAGDQVTSTKVVINK